VADLVAAACTFPDPAPLIEEGLESLRTHRSNYDEESPSPTKLQLLWWMFPKEHWVELHEGCSMNFLVEPRCKTTPNSEMDEEQIVIGEDFLDELVSLGALIKVAPGEMVANGPLFCLPKPGQPGQWRILSDMRRGGQNEAIGAGPTVFPKSGSILEQLYTGGNSAVIDASKFFYQFPTRADERKYLGCIHPRWDDLFDVYAGLPMGAGNSPSIAGRYGAAFLRLLRSKCDLYQGRPDHNTWWGAYQRGTPFNPNLGQGRVLIGADGIPAVLCKGHCDDFLVHGPTYDTTFRALTAFLNCAVDVGLLCHPGKLAPPAHVVKYTGLLFDTVREPILRIPPYKIDKALAMIDYILDHGNHLSRLSLAVVVGVLESLVEATPTCVGHTFLQHLHENLHPHDWEDSDLPYFSLTTLDERDIRDLNLWKWLLQHNEGRSARAAKSGTLIPSLGDGSGTGTGGAVRYADDTNFEMWMGVWSPRVYHFSSLEHGNDSYYTASPPKALVSCQLAYPGDRRVSPQRDSHCA
jgi:hypothetical protein